MESFNQILKKQCDRKNSSLCIGLDVDNKNLKNTSVEYMKDYIFDILELISTHIGENAVKIADAKRGDIGNSSKYYAEAILDNLNFDAITVSPYMGEDSISPFIENSSKGVFILCLTSNNGSKDFQSKIIDELELYKHVAKFSLNLNENNNIGLVVGATKTDQMLDLKEISGELPWLMPGVGFQGGDLKESIRIGSKNNSIAIINVSRGILNYKSGTIEDINEAVNYYTKQIRQYLWIQKKF